MPRRSQACSLDGCTQRFTAPQATINHDLLRYYRLRLKQEQHTYPQAHNHQPAKLPHPRLTSSDLFRDVITNLDEIHISLTQESNPYGGSLDYTHIEVRTLPAHFIGHWLAPLSSNLRALSIYSLEDNWCPFPGFFDFSTVSFPRLESLALEYYTLTHNDSIIGS